MRRVPPPARLGVALAVGLAACGFLGGRQPARAQSDPACAVGAMPYGNLPGTALIAETHASKDATPVRYVRWRGTVPGYDGMPFSVDVTLPCGRDTQLPTVVMAHGFTDDKTIWQETGRSDTVESSERPGSNSRWNNIWFASRGYAVVNYTARGWRDSCGPATAGATPLSPAPQCAAFEYWIHLDDMRWEVRDAQWLAGGLVQSGHADADRLAVTGGSYGGAPAAMAALLADHLMCGGAAVPPELGADPCVDRTDGALAPWTTPDGSRRLTWQASLPMYTFGDLIQVLAPNGRTTDGWTLAPAHGDVTRPFGVPIQSTVAGLLAAGSSSGFFAPPGVDPDADIYVDAGRLLAGNPFPAEDPIVARGTHLYRAFKSPIAVEPRGRVPIFWVHGFTDPLFPAFEPLTVRSHVLDAAPTYPFKLFLGDIGHDYSGERKDEWDLVKSEMNAFLDHALRPDRTPKRPAYDVTATITRCLERDDPLRVAAAAGWHDLHPRHARFESSGGGVTSTATMGPAGLATDPITTASLPLPGAYKGCRIMRPSEPDPTAATFEFEVTEDLVLLGGPVIEVSITTTAPDVPLSARLWHVAPDGSAQGLVTRGTYRVDAGPGPVDIAYQLAPQGYRFPAGHRLKLELTANDAPYFQASNVPALVSIGDVALLLPLLGAQDAATPVEDVPQEQAGGELPATGPASTPTATSVLAALLIAAAGFALRSPRKGMHAK